MRRCCAPSFRPVAGPRGVPLRLPPTNRPAHVHGVAGGFNQAVPAILNAPRATLHGAFPAGPHLSARGLIKTKASAAASDPSSGSSNAPVPWAVIFSVAMSCAGALAFGYHLGIVNGPLEAICAELGVLGDKSLEGMVVSSTLLGAAVGSFGGGSMADWIGRRKALLLASIPMLIGPLLSATAMDFNGMLVGRLITGLAIGLSSALVPLYVSEIAPTAKRGALGTVNQLSICFGILLALIVNVALPVWKWRDMFMIGVLPALVLAVGMVFSPESPRWLSANGLEASAEVAARKLWGRDASTELGTKASGGSKEASDAAPANLFGEGYQKPVIIGCLLFMFQQFAGINAIVYFSTAVFSQAGFESGALASVAVSVTNIIGTLIAGGIIEKTGRKTLLSNSYLGQAAAMFTMAAGFALPALRAFSGAIAVGGTLIYIFSFALGAGPVTGLIIPEINSAKIRGRAVAAAFVCHWVCNVIVGQTFMGAVDKLGLSAVYMGFGLVALLATLYINSQVPETKGKSFDQIQAGMNA